MVETTENPKLSEAEFLRVEAELAKAKVQQSLNNAKAAFSKSMDLRPLARRHPWVSIASAAVAGFVAVMVAVPSKNEVELRRMERLQRALHPDPITPASPHINGSDRKPVEKQSWGTVLLKEIIQIIRPILMAAITANIKGAANPPAPTDPASSPDPQGPDNSF